MNTGCVVAGRAMVYTQKVSMSLSLICSGEWLVQTGWLAALLALSCQRRFFSRFLSLIFEFDAFSTPSTTSIPRPLTSNTQDQAKRMHAR